MARIRTIKPEFFKHEELFDAERESGLPLRLAFISLWTIADREGRFKWRPRSLKVECLPYDECDFSRVLDALATRGFLVKYEVGGEVFGAIPSFCKHQFINNKEPKSELPEPREINILTRDERVEDANSTPLYLDKGEGKGREYSVANATGAEAPIATPDYPTDPTERLWAEGVYCLKLCDLSEKDARSNIGRWLKGGRDPGYVLDAIRRAREHGSKDPIALVSRILAPSDGPRRKTDLRWQAIMDSQRDADAGITVHIPGL